MEKKVILLTGASGGLGKELSKHFLNSGHQLALQFNGTPLETKESSDVLHVKCDLCDEQQITDMVQKIINYFGKIDVLVNNAGISKSSISWKTSSEIWKKTMAVNLDAPFFLSKAVIPYMRQKNEGLIVNISSIVAQTGMIGTAAYAASKAGLFGLTKTLSKELAPNKIRVNTLALGYFNTGMIEDVPEDLQEEIQTNIPLKEFGKPNTIANTIEWLMHNDSEYITGQIIGLNGGLY